MYEYEKLCSSLKKTSHKLKYLQYMYLTPRNDSQKGYYVSSFQPETWHSLFCSIM